MAGVRRVAYTFGFEGGTYAIRLPLGYYENIDTVLGLTPAGNSAVKGKFLVTKRQALRNGALVELSILYKKGNRLQTSTILCPTVNAARAMQELENKNYRTYPIHSAYFGQRRRLG